MSMPEHINAIKTITYYVPDIVDSLKEMNDDPDYEPDIQEIMEYIEDWILDDLGDLDGVILQDENGNEL